MDEIHHHLVRNAKEVQGKGGAPALREAGSCASGAHQPTASLTTGSLQLPCVRGPPATPGAGIWLLAGRPFLRPALDQPGASQWPRSGAQSRAKCAKCRGHILHFSAVASPGFWRGRRPVIGRRLAAIRSRVECNSTQLQLPPAT